MLRVLAIVSLFFSLLASAHAGGVVKSLDFNIDGVLPSNDPEIEFFTNSGLTEAQLYSVADGLLSQRTLSSNGNSSYDFPNAAIVGGGLDDQHATIMEARLNVLQIEGTAGVFFQAFDGVFRYSVFFNSIGLKLLTTTVPTQISVDINNFTTYRLASPEDCNVMHLYVDGVLAETVQTPVATLNGFGFGDGITEAGSGGDADWDYINVHQPVTLATDVDNDGVDDAFDNCVTMANGDQRDSNGDGYGNQCDPDLNDDALVNFVDLQIFKLAFFSQPGSASWNPDADFNGDDIVNFPDLALMKSFFFAGPGPSCTL